MTLRFESFVLFFLAAAVLGPCVAYSKLYLFHVSLVALILAWIYWTLAKRRVPLYRPRSSLFYFLPFMLLWYFATLLWSIQPLYTLRYVSYIAMGLAIVFFVVSYAASAAAFTKVFSVLAWMFTVEAVVALLEIFTPFRVPTSPYSRHAALFAKDTLDLASFSPDIVGLLTATPTAFLGNPNNLAVVLVSLSPYVLFLRRTMPRLLGTGAIVLIIVATGSRGAFLAFAVGFVAYCILARRVKTILISALIAILVLGVDVDTLKNAENPRIADLARTGDALRSYLLAGEQGGSGGENQIESISVRRRLIVNGLEALSDSHWLGVGGGASLAIQEESLESTGGVTSMHNFWIEILVEAGVAVFLCFVAWYLAITFLLLRVYWRSSCHFYRYHSGALGVGFMVFSVACVSASSVIYLLPMWLMFGMALAFLGVHKSERQLDRHGSSDP